MAFNHPFPSHKYFKAPKSNIIKFTLQYPPPPGHVTVRTVNLNYDSPARDSEAPLDSEDLFDMVTTMGDFKSLQPKTRAPCSKQRGCIFDDRTLAILLISYHLYGDLVYPGLWTTDTLGWLPRFHRNGTLDVDFGHIGRAAWILVDDQPHVLVANAQYALCGWRESRYEAINSHSRERAEVRESSYPIFHGPTTRKHDDRSLAPFCVSPYPIDITKLDRANLPIEYLVELDWEQCMRLFVDPRDPALAAKYRKRAQLEYEMEKCRQPGPLQGLERNLRGLKLHDSSSSSGRLGKHDGSRMCDVQVKDAKVVRNSHTAPSDVASFCASSAYSAGSRSSRRSSVSGSHASSKSSGRRSSSTSRHGSSSHHSSSSAKSSRSRSNSVSSHTSASTVKPSSDNRKKSAYRLDREAEKRQNGSSHHSSLHHSDSSNHCSSSYHPASSHHIALSHGSNKSHGSSRSRRVSSIVRPESSISCRSGPSPDEERKARYRKSWQLGASDVGGMTPSQAWEGMTGFGQHRSSFAG